MTLLLSRPRIKAALRRAVLPGVAFTVVVVLHVLWAKWFPEQDPAQSRWAPLPESLDPWFSRYVGAGEFWLAYAYGLSAALATVALRNLREARRASRAGLAEGGLAAGSLTFAGAMALGGCFLVGCCGSPMLAVWLTVFGAKFLPFAKPFVAAITTATVVAAWVWMERRKHRCESGQAACCAPGREVA